MLPTNIFELSDRGRDVLIARRMSGLSPVNWHGQSPRAIKSAPHPPFAPFTFVILPESESVSEYRDWANSSPVRPTIVAQKGGDLENLSLETVQKHFLQLCDKLPADVSNEDIQIAREAILSWKPMPKLDLGYQVGGHNTIIPNLVALTVAGYENMVSKRFDNIMEGIGPYVKQIVDTTNSIYEHRSRTGNRDIQRIFRRPPDLNLFAPSIYPMFFESKVRSDVDREEKKLFNTIRQALASQSGYMYEARTVAQKKALFGRLVKESDGSASVDPHPIVRIRVSELSLNTDVMSALTSSEFSACVRLPNEINRTLGSVRNFSEHYRSDQHITRKRLLAFRQVQTRLSNAVPPEFMDLIRKSETGIRVISDAHLEWLDLDGLPLAIRKNCSRIPVTPGNLFVHSVSTQPLIFLTPADFGKILVISSFTPDDPIRRLFDRAFSAFERQWRGKIELIIKNVSTIHEFIQALDEYDGPMVIFDGHGSHTKDAAAVLHIGNEQLDVWSLSGKIKSIPPIVVLSACDTHAADRNHATTANGFMQLGARTVLSSVFPLHAVPASIFAARLIFRVSEFLSAFIETFERSLTWTEVVSGMMRMQLLTDFLRNLRRQNKIDDGQYLEVHSAGNAAINGLSNDPFGAVLNDLERLGLERKVLQYDLEVAVANSSVISYLQIGRPETIIIDQRKRIEAQLAGMRHSLTETEQTS